MNREALLNLLFRMIQLQTTRSMGQPDEDEAKHSTVVAEGGSDRGQSTSNHGGMAVKACDTEGTAAQEGEGSRQSRNASSGDGSTGEEKHEKSSDVLRNIELRNARQNKSAIGSKTKNAWEEESKRHLAELYRERERQTISNQQKYGNLVMWIFIFWLIFVGVIISVQLYILYQNKEVFDWWTTSVLIASPSGILVVVFRILFPPKATSYRSWKKRRRK